MQKSKVTIIGGGIPGLALALILAQHNFAVTLVDRQKLPRQKDIHPSGRTTALMQTSLKILEQAGIWPDFRDHCCRLEKLQIIDDSFFPQGVDRMITESFAAQELDLEAFGYNVPLGLMTAFLADRVCAEKLITLVEGKEIDQNHKAIRDADLIVGADGRNSVVRQWAGIEAEVKDYGQTAITCLIEHSESHNHTSTEFHRPGGPCTFVPYANHQSAVVWVEKTAEAARFLSLSKNALTKALQERSRGVLGDINLITAPESWPLMSLRVQSIVASKTVLIAEAAHVLSPIGAQGLNLSLRDVGALADTLIAAQKTGQVIGSDHVLKAYAKTRRRDMTARMIGVDILNTMVAQDYPFIHALRRAGLTAMRYVGPLRKMLMRQGLAPNSR